MSSPSFGANTGDQISGELIYVYGNAWKKRNSSRGDVYYFTGGGARVLIPPGEKIPKDLFGEFEPVTYDIKKSRGKR